MMTATFCYRALLLVLFFVGFLALTTAVSVLIRNKLPHGLELNVHCQSGDDDLGEHVIPNKESYDWSFTSMDYWPFQTTLFSCNFKCEAGHVQFKIYVAGDDVCDLCKWEADENGLHYDTIPTWEWKKGGQ